jgi:phosphoglycolate phosphatase-like HAD superfamily hydrolase
VRGVLILDFDGTLCLGDAPVRAYAAEVAALLGGDPALINEPLDAFLATRVSTIEGVVDGYQAVAHLARQHGLNDAALSTAYTRSRRALDSGHLDISAPDGIHELLGEWSDYRRVLVTNAPGAGTSALLETLGIASLIDDVVGDARKPGGLERLLAQPDRLGWNSGEPLVSVGDIWVNDLAPVAARGGLTGLIERHAQPEATPSVRAPRIQDVLDELRTVRDGAATTE